MGGDERFLPGGETAPTEPAPFLPGGCCRESWEAACFPTTHIPCLVGTESFDRSASLSRGEEREPHTRAPLFIRGRGVFFFSRAETPPDEVTSPGFVRRSSVVREEAEEREGDRARTLNSVFDTFRI